MQSAQDWDCCDVADPLDRSPQWRILLGRAMRARLIDNKPRTRRHTVQVALAKNNDMVQAFAVKRPDQTLSNAILPRRSGRDRTITDAHALKANNRSNLTVGTMHKSIAVIAWA
jgi:hypothetical protein